MDGARYSIGELAELTGVSQRTVHFYVQRRLIDPPLGRGRGRHYDERHVRQIIEVRALQAMGVSLASMGEARTHRVPGSGGEPAGGGAAGAGAAAAPSADECAVPSAPAASTRRPASAVPGVPSVSPSIMSVVRVRLAENVTLELSPGMPVSPALVEELSAAVKEVLEKQGRAGPPGRADAEDQGEAEEES